ncbi:hypothetical protein [Methylobacterium aerolatum]|uniref:Uncharacterized protein n=1 Tax=Methylobacterium aerolatum TaxID=418708 RepID=A0ABU0I4U8_9HYPH|nr:hypothetical protein [Methylobacterium aerolatum]MDQ0449629.1 hypothetical protein [Methylobacterium aerolatum]GJD36083.1 hypothetical protein FMGBMHLM_2997 [Methylobacterium aerolatum]
MQPHDSAPSHDLAPLTPRAAYRPRTPRAHARYEEAALASAYEDGLMPDEVLGILAGRKVAEAFPVRWGESPEAYASRAVSEMFVSYLQ